MADIIVFMFMCLIIGIWIGAIIRDAQHRNCYRAKGHCPADDAMCAEAKKKKAEAERILNTIDKT